MVERTTVRLPEDLLRRAKRKAAAEGRTLTALIEDGLRLVVTDGGSARKKERVLKDTRVMSKRVTNVLKNVSF